VMNINKKIAAGIGLLAGALGLYLFTRKAEAACEEGQTKCEGTNLYGCVNGVWELLQENSTECGGGGPTPECETGETKCVGTDLYTCVAGEWQLTESDSPSCKVTPPAPLPEGFEIDKIAAEPPVVILGNPVDIKIDWFCPNPNRHDRTFSLQCVINGETLQHTWTTDMGNGSIAFEYTPASVGVYTATIQGDGIKFNCPSSVSFEVREEVVGRFYSPFGGFCSRSILGGSTCEDGYTPYDSLDALADALASATWTSYGGIWQSRAAPGAGRRVEYVKCPYCSKEFTACTRPSGLSCSHAQRLGAVYGLLDHIQSYHPNHPLTKPRCHIEVIVPQLPSPIYARTSPGAYPVIIDGHCHEIGYSLAAGYSTRWIFNNIGLFANSLGNHHIEVYEPLLGGCWRYYHGGSPLIASQDITLTNLGDKAVYNVEAGTVEYVPWS